MSGSLTDGDAPHPRQPRDVGVRALARRLIGRRRARPAPLLQAQAQRVHAIEDRVDAERSSAEVEPRVDEVAQPLTPPDLLDRGAAGLRIGEAELRLMRPTRLRPTYSHTTSPVHARVASPPVASQSTNTL